MLHDAAGKLRGPENLYENVTMGTVSRVERFLPATKGEVQDTNNIVQDHNAEFEQYKNETNTIINTLVNRLNSLTPVGCLSRHA